MCVRSAAAFLIATVGVRVCVRAEFGDAACLFLSGQAFSLGHFSAININLCELGFQMSAGTEASQRLDQEAV